METPNLGKTPTEIKAEALRVNLIRGSIGLAGSIGFCAYAFHKGFGFWGKVGMFFLGGIVVGIPANIVMAKKLANADTALSEVERAERAESMVAAEKWRQEQIKQHGA